MVAQTLPRLRGTFWRDRIPLFAAESGAEGKRLLRLAVEDFEGGLHEEGPDDGGIAEDFGEASTLRGRGASNSRASGRDRSVVTELKV